MMQLGHAVAGWRVNVSRVKFFLRLRVELLFIHE